MKTLRRYTVIGILFVMLTGTLAHFLYDWSGKHGVVGLFSPVNESVWEHMKLLFFPMLLYSLFLIGRLKGDFPCLPSSLWAGLLAGTLAIPLLYYGYTCILGRDVFLLDLGIFLLSVLIAFRIACRLALSCKGKPYGILLGCFVCILLACFLWFTYHPPKAGLFTDPTAREEAVLPPLFFVQG